MQKINLLQTIRSLWHFSREMEEGTVIEITLTRPGEEPMTTNMKIQQSDLDLMREIQDMAKNQ